MTSEYIVYFTDATLKPIGQPINDWTLLDLTLRFNSVDSYSVTAPATPELLALAVPPNRIVILRSIAPVLGTPWQYLCSGPIEVPGAYAWSADSGDTAPPGQVVMQFADDGVCLTGRVTYPTYTSDFEHQTGAVAATLATPGLAGETAIKTLVSRNAGPSALTARRAPNLTVEADSARGTLVTYYTRFELLTDIVRTLALAAGGLGYRTVQVAGPALEFQIYEPVDRSDEVIYSVEVGNVRSLSLTSIAPLSTVALVGGDGTGTSRVMVEVIDTAAVAKWGRIEVFVNNQATDVATLTQAGLVQLAQDAEQALLSLVATDNAGQVFGGNYNLGDIVGVEYAAGAYTKDVVTSVSIKVDAGGETVSPTIGTGNATTQKVNADRKIRRRLSTTERG